jgi:hypothetical protein
MSNKFKAFGLALVAAFAIGAVAASAASAHEFHSEAEHTILDSESIGIQLFRTDAGNLECKKVSLNPAESTIGPEESTTTEVTATPEYEECKKEGTTTKVYPDFATNKCAYVFTSETDANGHAEVHIECAGEETEGGQGVIITATAFKLNCVDVPPQTVGGNNTGNGVHYTNTNNQGGNTRDIDVEATIEDEIHYTQTGVCGSGTKTNGDYTGTVTVTGTDTNEEQVGIWVE